MEEQVIAGRGIELVSGLGFGEVRARLQEINFADESTHRALAFYLAEVAERKLYEDGGHSSAAHFAEAQLEMSDRRARDLIRVGRELRGLELVDRAFFAGEIGWTKVLLLLRVVQVTTQEPWIQFARAVSTRELDEEVRKCRTGELPGEGSRLGLDNSYRTVKAKLDDQTSALFEKAREYFLEKSGREEMTDSELLTALTKQFAIAHPEIDEDDTHPDDDFAERVEFEDRNHEPIPASTRDQVLARDRHRCRNCHSYHRPEIHHVEPRASGGTNAPNNLAVLCHTCHGLVHRRKLLLERNEIGSVVFLSADRTPVNRRAPANPAWRAPATPN